MQRSLAGLARDLRHVLSELQATGPTGIAGVDANLERAMLHVQLALYDLGAESTITPAFRAADADAPMQEVRPVGIQGPSLLHRCPGEDE